MQHELVNEHHQSSV